MSLRRTLQLIVAGASLASTSWVHAELLGLSPHEPVIEYAPAGVVDYQAADGLVSVFAVPTQFMLSDPFRFGEFEGYSLEELKLLSIQFRVDSSGQLLGGVDGPDLVLTGAIDLDFDGVVDYEGALLEAEVTGFGFADGAGGSADRFDLRFNAVAGVLAPFFAGRDLVAVLDSEPAAASPEPFAGGFGTNFRGRAKLAVGALQPVVEPDPCTIDVEAFCAVAGGANQTVCQVTLAAPDDGKPHPHRGHHRKHARKHHPRHDRHGHRDHRDRDDHDRGKDWLAYGYGRGSEPPGHERSGWASPYRSASAWSVNGKGTGSGTPDPVGAALQFSYVVTNTGTAPITNLQVLDAFATPVPGVPAALAPGETVTLVRTETLAASLIDTVVATGDSAAGQCTDTDTIAVEVTVPDPTGPDDDDPDHGGPGDACEDEGHGHDPVHDHGKGHGKGRK